MFAKRENHELDWPEHDEAEDGIVAMMQTWSFLIVISANSFFGSVFVSWGLITVEIVWVMCIGWLASPPVLARALTQFYYYSGSPVSYLDLHGLKLDRRSVAIFLGFL